MFLHGSLVRSVAHMAGEAKGEQTWYKFMDEDENRSANKNIILFVIKTASLLYTRGLVFQSAPGCKEGTSQRCDGAGSPLLIV